MWMGTLGFVRQFPHYAQRAPGQFGWDQEELESWLYQNSALTPLELLAAGRWWIVLAIALTITACYFPLRKLFGAPVAMVTTLYIGWSPFYLALSRQLHPDGLAGKGLSGWRRLHSAALRSSPGALPSARHGATAVRVSAGGRSPRERSRRFVDAKTRSSIRWWTADR